MPDDPYFDGGNDGAVEHKARGRHELTRLVAKATGNPRPVRLNVVNFDGDLSQGAIDALARLLLAN